MNDFTQMHIFFVVSTFATIVLGLLLAACLFYGLRLMRTLDRIASAIEGEMDALSADISDVRKEGKHLLYMFQSARKAAVKLIKPRRKRTP